MSQTETPGLISKQQVSPFQQCEVPEDKSSQHQKLLHTFFQRTLFGMLNTHGPLLVSFMKSPRYITKSIHYLSIRSWRGRNMWPCCLEGSIRMFYSRCSVSLLILRSLDDLDVQSAQPGWPWQITERKQKHGNWVAFVWQFQMGRRVFTWNLYRPLSELCNVHRSWHPPVKTRHGY